MSAASPFHQDVDGTGATDDLRRVLIGARRRYLEDPRGALADTVRCHELARTDVVARAELERALEVALGLPADNRFLVAVLYCTRADIRLGAEDAAGGLEDAERSIELLTEDGDPNPYVLGMAVRAGVQARMAVQVRQRRLRPRCRRSGADPREPPLVRHAAGHGHHRAKRWRGVHAADAAYKRGRRSRVLRAHPASDRRGGVGGDRRRHQADLLRWDRLRAGDRGSLEARVQTPLRSRQ